MARIVFAMNLSLDGYADHDRFAPDPVLFRHWIAVTRAGTCSLYGRKLYDLMRYWDEDQPDWGPDEHDFAAAWRALPKWVASRSLKDVGPNARLVEGDLVAAVRALKDETEGQTDVGGPALAQVLGEAGLIDEYHLYYHPVVLGSGRPLFDGPLPRLQLAGMERIGEETVKLTYRRA
jgi:dihydrofolate reductase